MDYSPKSPWYFVTLAGVALIEAIRVARWENHVSGRVIGWWAATAVLGLIGAGVAWRRLRLEARQRFDNSK
jgi:hypothetical protein